MAKRPLKVFRTAIGFHDAYVATTSRKAALQAWGAGGDLFSSGAAEQVIDPALTKAPLQQPGLVIRVARGTTAQHLAAAGKDLKREAGRKPARDEAGPPPLPTRKVPRPSRTKLDKAEAVLKAKSQAFAASVADIHAQIEALRKQRDDIRRKRDQELSKLEQRRSREEDAYHAALREWQG
ncbi:hypothetical protein GR702_11430 [Novosphingobium sp. FGD1]|uniref:Cell envelope biogenesis protein TolA n=1 Tax=Novosphingobium silvae TaxID=2692619 RepID=A0A7X4GHE6_9SPHN|nr:hypothetical protein [Novosphingobium silvae]MYL98375.1 hypothetical protein [Novosphingobium silvae]